MIVKHDLAPFKVLGHVWRQLAYAGAVAILAVVLQRLVGPDVQLPFAPVGTVGAAVAIFVAFRNNAAYARWWEGRTLWGSIHSSCRVFSRLVVAATVTSDEPATEAYRREMVLRMAATAHAARLQLRAGPAWARARPVAEWTVLRPLLPPEEYAAVGRRLDVANMLLQRTAERIKDGVRTGLLGQSDPISLEPSLSALNAAIAGCERLADTPTPRQYDYFTRLSVLVFATLLPFGLLGVLPSGPAAVVVILSVLTAGIYVVLEIVGAVVEAPFAGRTTDVPVRYLCIRIERDLREQLGETSLPALPGPERGYLW
jgi:putative membrane protein